MRREGGEGGREDVCLYAESAVFLYSFVCASCRSICAVRGGIVVVAALGAGGSNQ